MVLCCLALALLIVAETTIVKQQGYFFLLTTRGRLAVNGMWWGQHSSTSVCLTVHEITSQLSSCLRQLNHPGKNVQTGRNIALLLQMFSSSPSHRQNFLLYNNLPSYKFRISQLNSHNFCCCLLALPPSQQLSWWAAKAQPVPKETRLHRTEARTLSVQSVAVAFVCLSSVVREQVLLVSVKQWHGQSNFLLWIEGAYL